MARNPKDIADDLRAMEKGLPQALSFERALMEEAATALEQIPSKEEGKKTVSVRIAVAVNGEGETGCAMHYSGDEGEAAALALESLNEKTSNEVVHFVTADVPLPEPVSVEGDVEMKKWLDKEMRKGGD